MSIPYNHSKNRHTLHGPQSVLSLLFQKIQPKSLLDVGCGLGTWTKAAMDLGVTDILGLDGVQIVGKDLLIPSECFRTQDFTQHWNLGRQFEMALCLEVGEHLDKSFSNMLVRSLTAHAATVVFSAACPGQEGQHHVNCQWPVFWQELFNLEGFRCEDGLRWQIWNDLRVEPWYRQNIFVATKDPRNAGREERIKPVIHPEFLFGVDYQSLKNARFSSTAAIEGGGMPVSWYMRTPLIGLTSKLANRMRAKSGRA